MRVELFHHAGCRSADTTYRLVQECLTDLAIPARILVHVGDYPSPTVLVNAVDVMCPDTPLTPGSECRLDVPTHARVRAALAAQLTTAPRNHPSGQDGVVEPR
jgi:hypothetical protein